jgi:hypothetical protein
MSALDPVTSHVRLRRQSFPRECTAAVQRSLVDELAGASLQARIGAGVEGGREAAADVLIVGELGEVLVGEIGSAAQSLRGKEATDFGLLAPTPGGVRGCGVFVGAVRVHEVRVVGRAFGSLSPTGRTTRLGSEGVPCGGPARGCRWQPESAARVQVRSSAAGSDDPASPSEVVSRRRPVPGATAWPAEQRRAGRARSDGE